MIAELELPEPSVVIVMLTQTQEIGKEKRFSYFPLTPEDSPMAILPEFGDPEGFHGRVLLRSVRHLDKTGIDMREMTLEPPRSPSEDSWNLNVWHLSFSNWPDFSIPEGDDRAALVKLIRLSNKITWSSDEQHADGVIASLHNTGVTGLGYNPPRSTRVVHCSAGVGRTGTFIALDYVLSLLHSGEYDDIAPDRDPVVETVELLRQQRMMMVQNETQFNFIYDVLREEWERRERDLSLANREQEKKEMKAEEEQMRNKIKREGQDSKEKHSLDYKSNSAKQEQERKQREETVKVNHGRHSNDWLFGGFSVTEAAKGLLKRRGS
jgi:protein-tyrosine phosphatase